MPDALVEPIVGSISHTPAGTAAAQYARLDLAYDYAIAGLPFVDAASDQRPYARETAQYRKEQIDLSSTPGDQSLSGLWTRGQSSFHRGAGIDFYEVSEGEGVPNRYKTSMGVNPWTPGRVTLKPVLEDLAPSEAVSNVVVFGDALATLRVSGAVYELDLAGVEAARPSSDGTAATAVCSDGLNVYAAVGARIEVLHPSDTTFAALWTHHVGGRTWANIWWAKDRVWAVDNTGEWYTLDTVGGTTSGSDVLWTSGRASANWSLADSEGGVFIATGNTVWVSQVDTSTSTPTTIVPVAVASVGAQEKIANIGAYLGYLLILSDTGARIGIIQQGGVALGSLIVNADFTSCVRIGFTRSLFLAAGSMDGRSLVFEFAPLEQVDSLQAAYSPARDLGTSASKVGTLVLADRRVVAFGDIGVLLEGTDPAPAGSIETAQHRFGTLEPKDFRTLTVRAEGNGGTILVEKILRDGTPVTIVTLGPDNFSDNTLSLDLRGPVDSVGFRFTLMSDGSGNAPTLLGYQLRAMPAPKRYRLIQVPMMCFDKEMVGRVENGHNGWAWQRVESIEQIEQSGKAVMYQDFSTGESAIVTIERVQFQRTTPMKGRNRGWGGYLVLTLRTID